MNKNADSVSSILLSAFVFFAMGAQVGFAQEHHLTVINTGAGYGTVTSSPSGVNCDPICKGTFPAGEKIDLQAEADNDFSFAGWAGGGCTGIDPCSPIMDSDVTVTAAFDQGTPKISLSANKLDFNITKPGKKVTQTLVISNIGTGNLIVTVSGLDGTDFSISGKSTFTIKPGKNYSLKVNCVASASQTDAAEEAATEEPASGIESIEIEEDVKTLPEGTSSGASGSGKVKMKLKTNDPQNPSEDVGLVELAPLTPPKSLKDFINVPTWQLGITWSAHDAYEDSDWSASLDMTVSATYILTQSDKRPDIGWGRWHVESVKSWNGTYKSYLANKHDGSRTDYNISNQTMGADGAVFQVGSYYNPAGYELEAELSPIINATGSRPYTTLLALLTYDATRVVPGGLCLGPLPPSGLNINTSFVIPFCGPPFCGSGPPPATKVGIQFVLKPYNKGK
jgi:hypothetical protein